MQKAVTEAIDQGVFTDLGFPKPRNAVNVPKVLEDTVTPEERTASRPTYNLLDRKRVLDEAFKNAFLFAAGVVMTLLVLGVWR